MNSDDDFRFMRQALKAATEEGSDPALSPIGCVIVMNGKIVASQRNHVAELHDAVAHAEIEAIRAAGKQFENGELRGATLYHDAATLRDVHDGIDLVKSRTHSLWRRPRRRS